MIKNSLKYMKNYCNLSDRLKFALEYLEKTDLKNKPNGKYDILNDEIYINIQEYETKEDKDCKWEAHKRYIDIQYMIDGSEKIGVGDIHDFESVIPYDNDKDVEFLKTNSDTETLTLNENDFVILYPFDVHRPQMKNKLVSRVKKAVVKVLV